MKMSFRDQIKHIFRGRRSVPKASTPDKPQESGVVRTRHSPSDKPSDAEPHSRSAVTSQRLQLEGLWTEAYGEIEKDDPKLINAYQTALFREYPPEQGSSPTDTNREGHMRALIEHQLHRIQQSRLKITVAGKEIVAKEQARHAIHAILSVKDLITTAVSSEPHAALAWAGVLILLHPFAKSFTQDEDAMDGFERISGLMVRYRVVECTHIEIYAEKPDRSTTEPLEELGASIRSQTVKLYAMILRYQMRLAKHFSKSGVFRWMEDVGVTDNWAEMLGMVVRIESSINDDLRALSRYTLQKVDSEVGRFRDQLNMGMKVMVEARDAAKASEQLQLLNSLPVAGGASFDSFDSLEDTATLTCLEGTQVSTLTRIEVWNKSSGRDTIYWLRGMAGTGKSTISRTFATACHERKSLVGGEKLADNVCLGASFFFDHRKADRQNAKRLFTTISKQLAEPVPDIKPEICEAISRHPNIGDQLLINQWNYLILGPLLSLQKQLLLPLTIVLVIDALDECVPQSDLPIFLQLITQAQELSTVRLRLFVTSRPEAHICTYFHAIPKGSICEDELQKVSLTEDVNSSGPKDDITIFLEHELALVARSHSLEEGWPGESRVRELARKSDGLFIYAATACRFLQGARFTQSFEMRLNMIFNDKVTQHSPQENLDRIYSRILQFSVIGNAVHEEKELICGLFRQTVGAVVILCEPLSTESLSNLLSLSRSTVEEILGGLSSVLSMGRGERFPVQLLHRSFHDFLVDPLRCTDQDFLISPHVAHDALFRNCLAVLSRELRQDICRLSDPFTRVADMAPSTLERHLPVHVQYACRYWIEHLRGADIEISDDGDVHGFLKVHFLHWLEVLILAGKMSEGISLVLTLSDYISSLSAEGKTSLRQMVHDARRFVLKFRPVIEEMPLQIYHSVLIYCPQLSVIRQQFRHRIPKPVVRLPETEAEWNPLLQTLEDDKYLEDVAFSPDRTLVASSTVHIWNTATGTLLKTFDPIGFGRTVAFSSNGKLLKSLSRGGALQVWDIASGQLVYELKSSSNESTGLLNTFSSDGTVAVSVSGTATIELLDVINGETFVKFEAHSNRLLALALSQDTKRLASASSDGTVRLWDVRTGTLRNELKSDSGRISRVALSQDGRTVATVCPNRSLKIWDTDTAKTMGEITGFFQDIVFSPDGKVLATVEPSVVKLWDVSSGSDLLRAINTRCIGLRFSPDGRYFTSARLCIANDMWLPADKSIEIWDTTNGDLVRVLNGHSGPISDVSFSMHNHTLASASEDGTVRLWDLTTNSQSGESQRRRRVVTTSINLSPNRKIAASISDEICLWNVETGALQHVLDKGHKVFASRFSPDGGLFVAAILQKINVWDTSTGQLARTIKHYSQTPGEFAISPDGSFLAYGFKNHSCYPGEWGTFPEESEHLERPDAHDSQLFGWRRGGLKGTDGPEVGIWDMVTGTLLHIIWGNCEIVQRFALSLDGKMLAFAPCGTDVPESEQNRIEIWDVTKHELLMILRGTEGIVQRVAWSPDGKNVASTSADGKIRLWDATTGTMTRCLDEGLTRYMAFSSDSQLLISASDDHLIRVWKVSTGTVIGTRKRNSSPGYVRFSEDGKAIDTGMGRMDIGPFYPGWKSTTSRDFYVDGNLIIHGTKPALILPHDYQASCAAAIDNTLVIGHESGHVTFLELEASDGEE
ncbi:hypothetical protein BBP40_009184 [Aspergillus hancockii]|nr:hypothetical protein BBP40_009184 [Aspergillus hancockii]